MSEGKMRMTDIDAIFTHGLCKFLRQRPKIVAVNEARDENTMSKILTHSSTATVVSTIHN